MINSREGKADSPVNEQFNQIKILEKPKSFKEKPRATCFTTLSSGELVCGYTSGAIRFYNPELTEFKEYKGHQFPIKGDPEHTKFYRFTDLISLTALKNNRVASIHIGQQIYIHDAKNQDNLGRLEIEDDDQISAMTVLQKGQIITSDAEKSLMKIWNSNGKYIDEIKLPAGSKCYNHTATPDGNLLYTTYDENHDKSRLHVWNARKNETLTFTKKIGGRINQLITLSDELAVVSSHLNTMLLVDLKNNAILDSNHNVTSFAIGSLAYLPNGYFLVGNFDHTEISLYKIDNDKMRLIEVFSRRNVSHHMHALPDGRIVFGNENGEIEVFEIPSVKAEMEAVDEFSKVRDEALNPFFPPVISNIIKQYDICYEINRFFASTKASPVAPDAEEENDEQPSPNALII